MVVSPLRTEILSSFFLQVPTVLCHTASATALTTSAGQLSVRLNPSCPASVWGWGLGPRAGHTVGLQHTLLQCWAEIRCVLQSRDHLSAVCSVQPVRWAGQAGQSPTPLYRWKTVLKEEATCPEVVEKPTRAWALAQAHSCLLA